MQLSHTRPVASAIFDDPNLVSCAGLVPIAALAQQCGLARLADEHLSVPTDKGANAGAKVSALVAGMIAGADSIDDMRLLRHGARSEEHTSELQSLMRISYAVFCLHKKTHTVTIVEN